MSDPSDEPDPSDARDAPDAGRSVTEEYLRSLARTLGSMGTVEGTSLFPRAKPETLVVSLRDAHFPPDVTDVRLEIRAYANGDFHVTYVERYVGERRQRRWDRHDQPHSSRDHFHPLPDAATTGARGRAYPDTVDAVLERNVLPWIDDRIGDLWAAANRRE